MNTIFFKYLIAPSAIDRFSSVISEFSSIVEINPNPWHVGQAPSGELKEKSVGSNFPTVNSQYGQA